MEPRIQYAKTSDGVSIAYWTIGEGPPLVMTSPLAFGNIAVEWEIAGVRALYERLASTRKLVRFDLRGEGMSERGISDFSLPARVRDLEAVVNRAGLDRFNAIGCFGSGRAVIMFASQHPERIQRLVLWSVFSHSDNDVYGSERAAAITSLAERDWDLAVETLAHAGMGWARGTLAHEWATFIRASINQDDFVRLFKQLRQYDVSDRLADVSAPTLVIHHPIGILTTEQAQTLASRIPNAQLARVHGEPTAMYEHDEGIREIEGFLSDQLRSFPVQQRSPSGMTAILFADISDSTALTERLGDAAFRAKARELGGSLRAVVRESGGTTVEGPTLGDGVLAVFTSAREAIEAARRCAKAGDDAGLPLHVGLHAGDVTREKDPDGRDNVYGGAVNIAARISGLSAPSEVLVSETVRSLARTSAGVRFEDRGEQELKGVGEAVRVWAVREGE